MFLRKWVSLTAEELGRLLGHVKRGTISRWENEKIPITPATYHQMLLLVLRLKEEAITKKSIWKLPSKKSWKRLPKRLNPPFQLLSLLTQ